MNNVKRFIYFLKMSSEIFVFLYVGKVVKISRSHNKNLNVSFVMEYFYKALALTCSEIHQNNFRILRGCIKFLKDTVIEIPTVNAA